MDVWLWIISGGVTLAEMIEWIIEDYFKAACFFAVITKNFKWIIIFVLCNCHLLMKFVFNEALRILSLIRSF